MTQIVTDFSQIASIPPGTIFACPTDTVYGLSCLVDDIEAVAKIRSLKDRGVAQPLLVLISSLDDLRKFGIRFSEKHVQFLHTIWPGPVSVECAFSNSAYEHISGEGYFGVRMPHRSDLCAFIKKFGPIISTSANLHGEPPATNASAVLTYFPIQLDFLVDMGECNNPPSTLIKILR